MQDSQTKPTHGIGTVLFDLETNGLLNNTTRIHCASLYWVEDDLLETYNDEKYSDKAKELPMGSRSLTTAVTSLECANTIVGHNIIGFDIPIIKKLYPFFTCPPTVIDTLILSRLYHPNLLDLDKKHEWEGMPTKLYGSHSLEAYGYRLGEYKGDYAKTSDWSTWSQEMEDYCKQDVIVTKKLCEHFQKCLDGSN